MNEINIKQIDLIAKPEDEVEVSILPEVGFKDRFKLYINVNGVCLYRMCKLTDNQIKLDLDAIL